jgi:hypothetical protein
MAQNLLAPGWRVAPTALMVLLLTLICSGAAHADTWSAGRVITYDASDWATGGSAYLLLASNFSTVYPTATILIGEPIGGFIDIFDNPAAISMYLPTSGPPFPLNSTSINPVSDSSGSFGGDVLTLKLNVDFSDADVTLGSSGLQFGDLVVMNLTPLSDLCLNGLSVRQILALDNTVLGGGIGCTDFVDLDDVTEALNFSFEGGTPSSFAQDFLVAPNGTTGITVPESSSLLLLAAGVLGLGLSRCGRSDTSSVAWSNRNSL